MNIKDLIALTDTYAPSAYADMLTTDWGVLFWDDNNPTQHDANHACILNDALFEKALIDIQNFYLQKGREPRIYLQKNQKEDFAQALEENGFKTYSIGDFHHFLLTEENKIPHTNNLEIRELTDTSAVTEELLQNLYAVYMADDPDTINRRKRLLPRYIENEKCRVFCGYFENHPATLAMVADTDYGLQFFDLVETAEKYRCLGFARELISYLVSIAQKPTFLYSENPTAIRIYEQAGFREIAVSKESVYWRAVYQENK